MTEWTKCGYCKEVAVTLFKIELVTQHCYPTSQNQGYICDRCLQSKGVNPDTLARAISLERP